ncbi:protein of unknown function [Marinobacter pelagius]|uniref:DUF4124 domain-containing protein n=2 Tax=Marinobacter pelagius TaxID=379482 RepID=A0A1I4T3E8_9GAMM|nr:protein of unknown function [Marinobacter pelagius]
MLKRICVFLLATASFPAASAIYQCESNGQKVFSDQPCGNDAKSVEVNPVTIGGRLDSGTDVDLGRSGQTKPERRAKSNEDCPYINSTDLRRYIIKKTLVKGMKPADVRKAWGTPSSISTGRTTQWAYHFDDYSSRYVYFRNGCVTNWNGYFPQD